MKKWDRCSHERDTFLLSESFLSMGSHSSVLELVSSIEEETQAISNRDDRSGRQTRCESKFYLLRFTRRACEKALTGITRNACSVSSCW